MLLGHGHRLSKLPPRRSLTQWKLLIDGASEQANNIVSTAEGRVDRAVLSVLHTVLLHVLLQHTVYGYLHRVTARGLLLA